MKEPKRAFLGVWIPKEIWLSKSLTLTEKVLLVEISSLDNDDGCFASNQHFSEFVGLPKKRISEIINSLVKKGYITSKICYKNGTKQIDKRVLKVLPYLSPNTGRGGIPENRETPIPKKGKDSNTYISNIYVAPPKDATKENKKKVFDHDSDPYKLSKYLAKNIQENFPKKYTESDIQRWAVDIDLLIRLDKANPDDIGEVIYWAQHDGFWKANVLSGKKLRKNYDALFAKWFQERGDSEY